MDTLENIVNVILIPILPSLAILLGLYLQNLIQKAKAQLELAEGSQIALRLDEATQAVVEAIKYTAQTYVDYMKKQNAFDAVAQKEALLMAIQKAKLLMSANAMKTIEDVSGDADAWIRTMIEAKIKEMGNNQPLPVKVDTSENLD
ncbi:hypothetical protein [Proteiniclasticum sp. QWL-01]|uniref:hypothetical protein n=1 Tax=Proteiniclasticum sp. QWL-01 TaxID=3036945 RepID=UPI00240EF60B|nr:hypothetical protein [Proteiniclasticum sp. QWL-01]WFF72659.1 hypothetical protein P6M73_15525 [Proteiniclasticum sp. QWL-01]